MPTSTFFNLPPPKRDRLLRAAVEEFAKKPFNEVSINRIIQAAEIPRGSFYQYFEDKADLFQYILSLYARRIEDAVLNSLDVCGGDPLAVPLALFDLILTCIRENRDEFSWFLSILRQNVGMDAGRLLALPDIMGHMLERTDWSGLKLKSGEARLALLDLLLSSAGQSLMAACCGKAAPEDIRERLSTKIAIIRQGAEIKEEPCSNSTTS